LYNFKNNIDMNVNVKETTIEELIESLPIDMMVGRTYFDLDLYPQKKWIVSSYYTSLREYSIEEAGQYEPYTLQTFYGSTMREALENAYIALVK